MATAQRAEQNSAQALVDANVALLNTIVEAGYKAQTRGLNVARVFVEGAGRQQENARKAVEKLADPSLPFYAAERYTAFMNMMVENQNEALRIGREFIDELNAAAAEARQTIETIVAQAGKAREAQQAAWTDGFSNFQQLAGNIANGATAAAR